jgi:hypothetical protein
MRRALWLEEFIEVYRQLGTDNLDTLERIYHSDVVFVDPLHRVEGFSKLLESFTSSYQNVIECRFEITQVLESEHEAAIYWTMTYRHQSLNGKAPISVDGHSHLTAHQGKVIYHRDYLDLGAMLYEQVPLLGLGVKFIKKKAAN